MNLSYYRYLYSCIFFVQSDVFALWLFTYCINSDLFVNVIVSASIVAKYEYNCPPSQFVIGYGTFIVGIIISGIKKEKYSFIDSSTCHILHYLVLIIDKYQHTFLKTSLETE